MAFPLSDPGTTYYPQAIFAITPSSCPHDVEVRTPSRSKSIPSQAAVNIDTDRQAWHNEVSNSWRAAEQGGADKVFKLTLIGRLGKSQKVPTTTHVWKALVDFHNEPGLEPAIVAAKFFDPTYCDVGNNRRWKISPYKVTQSAVFREHESYRRMAPIQGDILPKFLGLYGCQILDEDRYVLVSLTEYKDAQDLDDLISRQQGRAVVPRTVCDAHKQVIFEQTARFHVFSDQLGVWYRHLDPEDILVWKDKKPTSEHAQSCELVTCSLHNYCEPRFVHTSPIGFTRANLDPIAPVNVKLAYQPNEKEREGLEAEIMQWFQQRY